jgi:hypothetical protein
MYREKIEADLRCGRNAMGYLAGSDRSTWIRWARTLCPEDDLTVSPPTERTTVPFVFRVDQSSLLNLLNEQS